MVLYNLSTVVLSNSTLEVITAINNDLTNGLFMILSIVALFLIYLLNTEYIDFPTAFLGASFITNVMAGFLWLAGLLPLYIMLITLVLPFVGLILVFVLGK